ncbi:MAG: class I SAM-dependent methyltransferase [Pedobacter sp.]|nr:class I SAM-dependent methyltransferase [Pedobacter sp.]
MRARDQSAAVITAYYDGLTPYYRFFYSALGLHYGLWDSHTRSLRQSLLNHKHAMLQRLGKVDAGSHVLDAGCGAGWTSVLFARVTACRVTGITLSAQQMKAAQRHAVLSGVMQRVQFRREDFSATSFPDASFSHAIASESSCYAPDKLQWLREMYRLLQPGGRLVIADYYLGCAEADLSDYQRRHYRIFCEGFAVPDLPCIADMEQWAKEAGFMVRESLDVTNAVTRTAHYIRWLGVITYPLGILLRVLQLAPPELLPHLRTCIHQPAALRELGSYRFITLEKPF